MVTINCLFHKALSQYLVQERAPWVLPQVGALDGLGEDRAIGGHCRSPEGASLALSQNGALVVLLQEGASWLSPQNRAGIVLDRRKRALLKVRNNCMAITSTYQNDLEE